MIVKLTFNCFFAIESGLSMNIKSPIRKLLFLTNQSSSDSFIYFSLHMFSQLKKEIYANMAERNKMKDSTLAYIDHPDFFIFIFKVNWAFMEEKDNPVESVAIDEEEQYDIEIYCFLNLENLPRTVFIG